MADKGLWGSVVDGAIQIVDKFVEDKDAKAAAVHELKMVQLQYERDMVKGQLDANIEQAKHPSVFVSGARPAAMWLLIAIIGWTYIGHPVASFVLKVFVPEFPIEELPPPSQDLFDVIMMLGGLLGLVGARSWEKKQGVARNSLKGHPQVPEIK